MAKKKDFRKISFNSGIAFILFGILLLVLGIVLNYRGYEGVPDDFYLFWTATSISFIIGFINIFAQDGIIKSTYLARIVVGALFVVSGIIKANDPLGFSFKLEEYFEPDALGWTFFTPYALPLSVFIAGSEIVLGLALLVGGLARLTSWLLFAMILFFAWLTHYTASCNDTNRFEMAYISALNDGDAALMANEWIKAEVNYDDALKNGPKEPVVPRIEAINLLKEGEVSLQYDSLYFYIQNDKRIDFPVVLSTYRQCVLDCGCFGDALKGSIGRSLTPWESFFKDLILLILIVPILLVQKHIKFNLQNDNVLIISGSLLFAFIVGKILFGWWFPLLFLVLFFGLYLLLIKCLKRPSLQLFYTALLAIVMSFGFVFYTVTYLPIKDYRPYAIGNNLIEKMNDGEDGIYDNVFVYRNNETGVLIEYPYEEYMANWEKIDQENTFIKKITKTLKFAIPNSIQDFRPTKNYNQLSLDERNDLTIQSEIAKVYHQYFETIHLIKDVKYGYLDSVLDADYDPMYYPISDTTYTYLGKVEKPLQPIENMEINFTSYLLNLEKCLLITSYKLGEFIEDADGLKKWEFYNENQWKPIFSLINQAKEAQIHVYIISNAPADKTTEFMQKYNFEAHFLVMDPIEIKIMIRSNPGIVYIEKAVVKGKWDYNRVPSIEKLK